jgi:hypothetical protein
VNEMGTLIAFLFLVFLIWWTHVRISHLSYENNQLKKVIEELIKNYSTIVRDTIPDKTEYLQKQIETLKEEHEALIEQRVKELFNYFDEQIKTQRKEVVT